MTRTQLMKNIGRYGSGSAKSKEKEGDHRIILFERFLRAIDVHYKTRSRGQIMFHQNFTMACLPHICGETEWEMNRQYYLSRYDLDEYRSEILVTTPRRFGKTTAVAMFVAALMCVCPAMWVSIFSTGKRASKSLLTQIKEVIDSIEGMTDRIQSSNVEELWLMPVNCTKQMDVSRCFSYPSSVQVTYHHDA